MTDPTEAYQRPKRRRYYRDPYKGLLLTAAVGVSCGYGAAALLTPAPLLRLLDALTAAYGVLEFARILTTRND